MTKSEQALRQAKKEFLTMFGNVLYDKGFVPFGDTTNTEKELNDLIDLACKEQRKLCFKSAKIDKLTKHGYYVSINANSILNAPSSNPKDKP